LASGGDLTNADLLFRQYLLIDHGPVADAVLVEFAAGEVQFVLIAVIVDQVAVAVLDGGRGQFGRDLSV
jgi:hypothetical protein